MKQSTFAQFILYRYRYIVGYGLFLAALIALLYFAGLYVPGALSEKEMQSAVISGSLQLNIFAIPSIIDLPYHALQRLSIELFGLTPFAIKLPSILLAFATGIGLLLLLRRWFKQNVAILAAIIAVTAGQFLIIAQSGTPIIMLLFWPTLLLLCATSVSAKPRFTLGRKIVFFIIAGLSLYTPLSIYVLVAMLFAALFHPHLRYMLLHLTKWKLLLGFAVGIVLLIPLGLHLFKTPGEILVLLGIPSDLHWALLWANAQELAHLFFGFAAPVLKGELLAPMYGIATTALMALGLFRLAQDHHSARTYTIGLWLLILLLFLLLQPSMMAITFVPLLLMLAVGVDTLFREWYGLFPRNPYARAAALIPLIILIGGLVFTGLDRYLNSYTHHSTVAAYFTNDLALLRTKLDTNTPTRLITTRQALPFYALLEQDYPNLRVSTTLPPSYSEKKIVVLHAALAQTNLGAPAEIVTSARKADNMRFYIYKTE